MRKIIILKKIKILKKFQQIELFKLAGRSLYSELRFSILTRFYVYFRFLLRDYYTSKKNLFCFFSYKNMGIIKPFKMYRMVFRQQCSFGLLSGIKEVFSDL